MEVIALPTFWEASDSFAIFAVYWNLSILDYLSSYYLSTHRTSIICLLYNFYLAARYLPAIYTLVALRDRPEATSP